MEETEISTPVEQTVEDTSTNTAPETVENTATDTATVEPETETTPAETETKAPDTLYAGKYKSVEELEKGYKEAEKSFNKANEFEKKYNELLEKQNQEVQRVQNEKLEQAKNKGFDSIESQEIADKVQLQEFEAFANNLTSVHPDYMDIVRSNLLEYYKTGIKSYLNEAKRYYSSDFIEEVARQKLQTENLLKSEYETKKKQEYQLNTQKLGETLKTDYADFLSDLSENRGKDEALKLFCNTGLIQSKADMDVFLNVYNQIAQRERELAIKEYEAKKVIDETKAKSSIDTGSTEQIQTESLPTYDDIAKMSQEEFNKACEKYGVDKIIQAK